MADENFMKGPPVDGFDPTSPVNKARRQPLFTRGSSDINPNNDLAGAFVDPSDMLANRKHHYIDIYNVNSKQSVFFKAFLTEFKDNFKTSYDQQDVFGRMDPIVTFKSTRRTISLGWTVPSTGLAEAKENLAKASLLAMMLYPTYDTDANTNGGASSIRASPIFKIKFANLIQGGLPGSYAQDAGLPGIIDGFTYDPILEEGMYDPGSLRNDGAYEWSGDLYPQSIRISLNFTVLHDRDLGWDEQGKFRSQDGTYQRFPYGGDNNAPGQREPGKEDTVGSGPVYQPFAGRQANDPREADFKSFVKLKTDLLERRMNIRAQKLLKATGAGKIGTGLSFAGSAINGIGKRPSDG